MGYACHVRLARREDPLRRTLDLEEAYRMAGVARSSAYAEVAARGTFMGIPIIRYSRRILVPRRALERKLDGLSGPETAGDDAGARGG